MRFQERRGDEDKAEGVVEEEDEGGGVLAEINNLSIETAGTEEEVSEGLAAVLEMEITEDRGSEGEEEGGGTQRALEAFEFLTQEADRIGTTLVDACNGFNKLIRLAMLWTVWHRWPEGVRFAFNCYRHWAQLLLRHLGELPVTIRSREGAAQGDPFSMVLYGINLVPLDPPL